MMKVIAPVLAVLAMTLLVMTGSSPVTAGSDDLPRPDALTVHEWGTFTTVAGADGQAADWLPLSGPNDLPCFVEHFGNNALSKYIPDLGAQLTYAEAATRLKAKVRMETPVLYFYSPREENLNVKVDFPSGLISEWYPHADVGQMALQENTLTIKGGPGSHLEWNNVKVRPGSTPTFASDGRVSHYYAARQTDALPVRVGNQDEKFLFYRGVGNFPVPLSAEVTSSGKISVANTGGDTIPAIVLFENREGKIGFRVQHEFRGQVTLDRPQINGDIASLRQELEKTLTESGLYAKEAQAMVETWRDSWFEEGTRVFYMLPKRAVDQILPLNIKPAPVHTVRSFVGRMEVITPDMLKDPSAFRKYGRFLGSRLPQALADSTYQSFLNQVSAACKGN